MRAAVLLLLLAAGASGQATRPESRPAPVSDDVARMLAASVSFDRISKQMSEISAFGAINTEGDAACRAAVWAEDQMTAAGLMGSKDGKLVKVLGVPRKPGAPASRKLQAAGDHVFLVSARLAGGAGTAPSAFLESARALQAVRNAGQLTDEKLHVSFELESACKAWSRGSSKRLSEEVIAEIRFGDIGTEPHDVFCVTIAGPAAKRTALVGCVERLLKQFKGEKGFWKEFEVRPDERTVVEAGVPRITVSTSAPAADSRKTELRPESQPKKEHACAVRAARFTLLLLACLAEPH